MNYDDIIIGLIAIGCIFYLYQKLFRKKGDCGCGGGGNCSSKKK
ncbi:FeoB-associated Cys-rich membrane protein [Arcobacter sp. CECT 8986]|nr:FeoB-associated Cys-rich membrane protein [Arcobacter sp. CECT 8986]RXK00245.1 FeoB-associated Cys-rich membrane protein [Arcobacter sp. CECT 8986]